MSDRSAAKASVPDDANHLTALLWPLEGLPRPANVLLCAALAIIVGIVDHATGVEIALSIFYLGPVLLATWLLGLGWGMGMSLICAAIWLGAETVGGRSYSLPVIAFWNAGIRLSFFLTGSYLLWRLKDALNSEREARQAAQEISHLKSEMVSLVSHEFGNGLASATMAVFMLKETEPKTGAENELRRQYYQVLDLSLENLKSVSANYLNLARIEAGRFTLVLQRTEFRALIRNALNLFELGFSHKRLRLRLELPTEVVPVRVDPDAMTLVVNNLIGNAIKYTPVEGEICISLELIPDEPAQVEFSVQDTGIGFSPDDAERIFSGFFRTAGAKAAAKGYATTAAGCSWRVPPKREPASSSNSRYGRSPPPRLLGRGRERPSRKRKIRLSGRCRSSSGGRKGSCGPCPPSEPLE